MSSTEAILAGLIFGVALGFAGFVMGHRHGYAVRAAEESKPYAINLKCPSCGWAYSITVKGGGQ